MRRAVDEAVERDRPEFLTAVQSGRAHHLDDAFRKEHERGLECCYDCSPNPPDVLLLDAPDAIRAYNETT